MPERYTPTPRHQPKLAPTPEATAPGAPSAAEAVTLSGLVDAVIENVEAIVHADPVRPVCPHCGALLIDHGVTAGPKAGAWHCDACGGCFVRGDTGWVIRDGHPAPVGYPAATAFLAQTLARDRAGPGT